MSKKINLQLCKNKALFVMLLFVCLFGLFSSERVLASDEIDVGTVVGSYQNSTNIGQVSTDSFDLIEVPSTISIPWSSTTMRHTITLTFRHTTDEGEGSPFYLFKKYDGSPTYSTGYKYVYVLSMYPFEYDCVDYGSGTDLELYNRSVSCTYARYDSAGNAYYFDILDLPGNTINEYFTSGFSNSFWQLLGFVYEYLPGTALDLSDYSNDISGFIKTSIDFTELTLVHLPETPPTSDTGTVNTDLGYIKDPYYKCRIVGEAQESDYTIQWDDVESTSGFLYTDSSYIQIQIQLVTYSKPFLGDGKTVSSDWVEFAFPQAKQGWFLFSMTTIKDMFADSDAWKNYSSGVLSETAISVNLRFRVCEKSGNDWQYGNWLVYGSDDPQKEGSFTSTDPDGNVVDDNPNIANGSKPSGEVGIGDTLEEADANMTPVVSGTSDTGIGTIDVDTFLSGIGEIPAIIADVFSFLPAWCLAFIASGFALFVVLMLIKAIRG